MVLELPDASRLQSDITDATIPDVRVAVEEVREIARQLDRTMWMRYEHKPSRIL